MKKTLDIKKLILLNMPYILLGLFATNFGEACRDRADFRSFHFR